MFPVSSFDVEPKIETTLRSCCEQVHAHILTSLGHRLATSSSSQPRTHRESVRHVPFDALNAKLQELMSQEENLVVNSLVYEILTDEEDHEFWFRHLELCSLNHFASAARLLTRIVMSSFTKLKPQVQGTLIWLLAKVMHEDIQAAMPILHQLLRYQAFSLCQVGFFTVWLSENLINLGLQLLGRLSKDHSESLALLFYSSILSARTHLHYLREKSFLQPPSEPSLLDVRVQRLCSTQLMFCTRLFDVMPELPRLVGKDCLRILSAFSEEFLAIPAVAALKTRIQKGMMAGERSASGRRPLDRNFETELGLVAVSPDVEAWVEYILERVTRGQLQWHIDWLLQAPRGPDVGICVLGMLARHPGKEPSIATRRRRARVVQGILDRLLAIESATPSSPHNLSTSTSTASSSDSMAQKGRGLYQEALTVLTFDPHHHVSGIDSPTTGSLLFDFLGRRQLQVGQHLQPLLRGLFKSPSSTGADPPHAPEDCLRDFLHSLDPSERRALALGLLELFDAQDDVRLVYKLRRVLAEVLQTEDPEDKAEAGLTAVV